MTTLNEIRSALNPEEVFATIMHIDDVGRDTKAGKLYSIHLVDDKTVMKLSVWDKKILEPLKKDQKIMIVKPYVSIFSNEPSLNLSKDSRIDILPQT